MKFLIIELILIVLISICLIPSSGFVAGAVEGEVSSPGAYLKAGGVELMFVDPPLTSLIEISAYTLGRVEETDDSPCISAYNINICVLAMQGIQTCASNNYPKGTKLKIGEGIECIVLDRMAEKYSHRIDLAMLDYEESMKWGVKELEVEIIN